MIKNGMDLYSSKKNTIGFHDDAPLTNAVNPIDRKYIQKSLYRFFLGRTATSDFIYVFKTTFANVVSMELKYIEIPNLW
jgi:hypothetical protein